jgi:curli production assembly/transport component CsgG
VSKLKLPFQINIQITILMRKYFNYFLLFLPLSLISCGTFFNQPLKSSEARIGENTSGKGILKNLIPSEETVVGVYKFRDQTGQYKPTEGGSSFSTAVTQGGTSILLKSLEESKWFKPIERENIGNLLNERQIIRSTRQEYSQENNGEVPKMPPLLFASIILEGGVISYDSNIITGGSGARYFGVGASSEYREDRITIYLRAVSTSSGRILKNVYVSKTILSQALTANLFRYVNVKKLLEVETGVTKNEPTQLAVKEAIDKAVELLIIEGIIDGLWKPVGGEDVIEKLKEEYIKEKNEAHSTLLYNRKLEDRRGKSAFSFDLGSAFVANDYPNSTGKINSSIYYKTYFNNPNLFLNFGVDYFKLENEEVFDSENASFNFNVGYDILPFEKFSPSVYLGTGVITNVNFDDLFLEFQYGLAFEYLPINRIGLKIYGEQNILLSDELEKQIQGKHNDYYWRVGLGINLYLGKPMNSLKSVLF